MPLDLTLSSGISPTDAWPQIACAATPTVVDVCPAEDRVQLPRLIPGAQLVDPKTYKSCRPVITVCSKGGKLSQGLAAKLRAQGTDASFIVGGMHAWIEAGLPTVDQTALAASQHYTAPLTGFASVSLTRWIVTRLLPPGATLIAVPAEVATDTASRFDAPLLPSPEAALKHFDLDLPQSARLGSIVAPLLPGIARLYGTQEAGQQAALPLFDAALAGVIQ